MLFELVVALLAQSFSIAYTWLNQYLVSPFLAFTRGFEFALIFTAAAVFFMISVLFLLRQAKKLPKSYVVEIEDVYGEKVSIDGVRQAFAIQAGRELRVLVNARLYDYGTPVIVDPPVTVQR